MYILGLNAFHGDSAACIFKDNKLLIAVEEERLRRIKHWAGFPTEAIKVCLKEAGISISDVDHITISRNPSANLIKKVTHSLTKLMNVKNVLDRISNHRKVSSIKNLLAQSFDIDENKIKAQIHNIEHHRSHLASAFFASPYKKAALLSIDGFGDFTSTMTAIGNNTEINVLDTVNFPHSIGIFYTAFTQYLGFMNYGDEYKVMGLAPYGVPHYVSKLQKIVELTNKGKFKLNLSYFNHSTNGVSMSWEDGSPEIAPIFSNKLISKFGRARKKEDELTQYHIDLAASVQRMTELTIFHIINHLHETYKTDILCMAGGVAQNSVANGKIYENTSFKKIYIAPAATDAGTAIGSALYLYNSILKKPRIKPMLTANMGSSFNSMQIENLLTQKAVEYKKHTDDELYEFVAEKITKGCVIGWYRGKAEFGPRALGNRSILVDPRRKDAKEILNKKIKKRESFRPFAPSVLSEHVHEYFEMASESPFMEKVFRIKKEKHHVIPAVTHIDGTGRLQTVNKETNTDYYNLINKFYEKTGVALLLNTSFNENEPIVNSPEEALDCFTRTTMDVLVLNNYVIVR